MRQKRKLKYPNQEEPLDIGNQTRFKISRNRHQIDGKVLVLSVTQLLSFFPPESCDPCDSTEVLPQPMGLESTTLSLSDSGFCSDVPSIPEQAVQQHSSGQTFLSSQMTQMSEIPESIENQPQSTSNNEVNNGLLDG